MPKPVSPSKRYSVRASLIRVLCPRASSFNGATVSASPVTSIVLPPVSVDFKPQGLLRDPSPSNSVSSATLLNG